MSTFTRNYLSPLLLLLCSSLAYAQPVPDTLLPVTVTGQKDTSHKISCRFITVTQTKEIIPLIPVTNFTKLLEGRMPGLQATNGGGQPGSLAALLVRGVSTVSGDNTPLIVLNGDIYTGDINAINLFDIQTITVFKDAVAGMRYGNRSAGGVIEVITKKGKQESKPKLTLNARAGIVTRALQDYNTMTSEQDYYETSWTAFRNGQMATGMSSYDAGIRASGPDGIVNRLGYNAYNIPSELLIDPATGKLNPAATLRYSDGDWGKAMQRTALRHEYHARLSGGGKKTSYYLSAAYLKEGGYIRNTDYERFSSLLNGSVEPLPWLKAGVNASLASATQNYAANQSQDNPFTSARLMAPIYPVHYYDINGNRQTDPLTGKEKYDWGNSNLYPNSSMGIRPLYAGYNAIAAMGTDQHQNKAWNWTATPFVEATVLRQFKLKSTLNYIYTRNTGDDIYNMPLPGSRTNNNKTELKTLAITQSLGWKKQLGLHSMDIQTGYEWLKSDISMNSQVTVGTPSQPSINSSHSEINTRGFFATANYDYDERYLLTAGFRKDNANSLSANEKWPSYWAAGAGWQIKNEKFLRQQDWLSSLKLKSSFGRQGYQTLRYPVYDYGAHATQWNSGLEFSLWDYRLSIEVDYYIKKHKNLMLPPFPHPITGTIVYARGMKLENRGFDLSLRIVPVRTYNIEWQSTIYISSYKNEILQMPEGYSPFLQGDKIWEQGGSVYDFYLPEHAGVNPDNGDELYYYTNAAGQREKTANYVQASMSRKNMGSALPDAYGSFHNEITYKNFSLSFLFTFGIGGKYYDGIYQQLMNGEMIGHNFSEDIKNSWTPDNKGASLPRLETGNINISQQSSRFLVSASYLNWRNISLEYNFTAKQLKKLKLQQLRVYISGDNIMLFSARKGMDPQAVFSGNPTYVYGPSRAIITGLSIGL